LNDWLHGRKKTGEIRKQLGERVWPSYGYGLWQETWSEFIREFGEALHPYAHYTSALQAWQIALMQDSAIQDDHGNYLLIAKVGLDTYDANKATRITLLHVLLSYVLGRVALANRSVNGLNSDSISALGKAIADSEELFSGRLKWHQQFLALEFTPPVTRQ
jgi:hypothetical protein